MIWGVMRKRWILAIFGFVVVFAIVLAATRDDEPVYQGRKLSEWVDKYETELKPDRYSPTNMIVVVESDDAAEAVGKIGTNALPYLLKWISYEPSSWQFQLHGIINSIRKTPKKWPDSDKRFRRASRAASAFKALGSHARAAIPELSRLLNDPKSNFSAARAEEALENIGPEALPTLTNSLRRVRFWANPYTRSIGTSSVRATNAPTRDGGSAQ